MSGRDARRSGGGVRRARSRISSPVARGECRDVTHGALRHAISLVEHRDTPALSTERTHGYFLFCGKPGVGRWRRGDNRLRASDIEWQTVVRIGTEQFDGFAILGQLNHTAMLAKDTTPPCAVADGQSVRLPDFWHADGCRAGCSGRAQT